MKIYFALGLAAAWLLNVQSQVLTVKDSETNTPLEQVTIINTTTNALAKTNAEGQADLSKFAGAPVLEIHRLGYSSRQMSYAEMADLGFEILLTPSAFQIDELVVSATRWSQSSRDVPAKITAISPDMVTLYQPQTAADLLGFSGEVFIQKSQQAGGSPMIRGFAANRLLYSVDGVRMNSAIFRSGNLQNVISLDPFCMENTEVLFGPGSVIYGSDAIGGVMCFQTLTPQLTLMDKTLITGKALGRYSSANHEITHHFDLNIGWKKWASVSSFSHFKFGDLRMGKFGPDDYLKPFFVQQLDSIDRVFANTDPRVQIPGGYAQTNLMQKFRYRPCNQWDIQYAFHYAESSDYPRYDRLLENQSNGLPVFAVWNYGPQIWMMHHLSAAHSGEYKIFDALTLRLARQQFEESRIDRRFRHHSLRTLFEKVAASSVNIDFEKMVTKHRLHYGLEYVHNQVTSSGSALDVRNGQPILVPDRYPASDWNSYAGYVNFQYIVSPQFLAQAGARLSAFRIHSDFSRHLSFYPFDFTNTVITTRALTGSLGFVYTPAASWRIKLHSGTGFRAPNVDDIGKIFDFVSGEVVVPNPSLSPENAYNAELSVSKTFGAMAKIELGGFYTYLADAMVRRAFHVGGRDSIFYNGQQCKVYAVQNAAFGRVFGFNAAFEINFGAGFDFSSRYNFQWGREQMEDGLLKASRHAAPAFGLSQIAYRRDKLVFAFYATYQSEVRFDKLNPEEQSKPHIYAKDADGNPYSPAWYAIHFKCSYRFHPNFSISSGVENITDQRYRPYSSGLAAPGRNLVMSLLANF